MKAQIWNELYTENDACLSLRSIASLVAALAVGLLKWPDQNETLASRRLRSLPHRLQTRGDRLLSFGDVFRRALVAKTFVLLLRRRGKVS